jgi:hypothetical protein
MNETITLILILLYNYRNKSWKENVRLNDGFEGFKLDTGFQANIISKSIYDKIRHNNALDPSGIVFQAYGGQKIAPLDEIAAILTGQIFFFSFGY